LLSKAVPVVTQDTLETMYISPSMSSFRLQLELCHSSNGEFTTYPKATVTSQKIIDGKCCFFDDYNVRRAFDLKI
jgi:hypothetical protein